MMNIPSLWDEEEIKFFNQITYKKLYILINPSELIDSFIDQLRWSENKKVAQYLISKILLVKTSLNGHLLFHRQDLTTLKNRFTQV